MSFLPEQVIADLKARQDIHDVLVRYCRAADRCDAAMMKSCYHDGAWDDHGFFSGPASEFAEQATNNLRERFISTKHYMTNESVEINADKARSETYILTILRMLKDGAMFDITASSRYLDHFERRNNEWKIVDRRLVSDGSRIDKVEQEDARINQGKAGARGADDPSYTFFGLTEPRSCKIGDEQ